MDVHLLHTATRALDSIVGSRISKIYQYDRDIYVFSLFGRGKKQFLTIRTGKNIPFLFLSEHHTARGEVPPSSVMRLRKHLQGKRIINMYCAWWARILFFQVSQEENKEAIWFKIDLKHGVHLLFSREEVNPYIQFPTPTWQELQTIDEVKEILNPDNKNFSPYFTPALRKTMQAILQEEDEEDNAFLEIKSLVIDLESGEGDLFLYTNTETNKKELYAWQLPKTLQKGKTEEIFENPLFALNEFGKETLLSAISGEVRKNAAKPFQAQIKKLKTLQEKLKGEEARLLTMYNKKEIALLLQAHLYELDKDKKCEEIILEDKTLLLDNKFSIKENMENFFHQSVRGKRGLLHLEKRKQEVQLELEKAEEKLQISSIVSPQLKISVSDGLKKEQKGKQEKNKNTENKAKSAKELNLPKQVLMRKSKDGFIILLGKDTKGNALALKLASPNDYWLHTADGASAHAIIKRDHAGVFIPEETLREAGIMVAEKSPFKNDEKALIQYSFAKNIQPMRNAGAGMVRIVKSEGSFWVSLKKDWLS